MLRPTHPINSNVLTDQFKCTKWSTQMYSMINSNVLTDDFKCTHWSTQVYPIINSSVLNDQLECTQSSTRMYSIINSNILNDQLKCTKWSTQVYSMINSSKDPIFGSNLYLLSSNQIGQMSLLITSYTPGLQPRAVSISIRFNNIFLNHLSRGAPAIYPRFRDLYVPVLSWTSSCQRFRDPYDPV